jgi:hypothetical protein
MRRPAPGRLTARLQGGTGSASTATPRRARGRLRRAHRYRLPHHLATLVAAAATPLSAWSARRSRNRHCPLLASASPARLSALARGRAAPPAPCFLLGVSPCRSSSSCRLLPVFALFPGPLVMPHLCQHCGAPVLSRARAGQVFCCHGCFSRLHCRNQVAALPGLLARFGVGEAMNVMMVSILPTPTPRLPRPVVVFRWAAALSRAGDGVRAVHREAAREPAAPRHRLPRALGAYRLGQRRACPAGRAHLLRYRHHAPRARDSRPAPGSLGQVEPPALNPAHSLPAPRAVGRGGEETCLPTPFARQPCAAPAKALPRMVSCRLLPAQAALTASA